MNLAKLDDIVNRLIKVAHIGELITYGDLGRSVNVWQRNLSPYLDELASRILRINESRPAEYAPDLTCIVVRSGTTMPSVGSFDARSEAWITGIGWDDIPDEQRRVWRFDWHKVQSKILTGYGARDVGDWPKVITNMRYAARDAARQSGQDFTGTYKHKIFQLSDTAFDALIEKILEAQEFRCALTGVPLEPRLKGYFKPSLDRIDSDRGYEEENLQVTTWFVNQAKDTMSNKEFREVWEGHKI